MGKFITHDCIFQGVFNRETCTASNALSAWQEQLVNTDEILLLLCKRLDQDFLSTPKKMRKPWNHQQVDAVKILINFPSCLCVCVHSAVLVCMSMCCIVSCSENIESSEEGLQRICAAFLACSSQFSASCPSDFVEEEKNNLLKGFLG